MNNTQNSQQHYEQPRRSENKPVSFAGDHYYRTCDQILQSNDVASQYQLNPDVPLFDNHTFTSNSKPSLNAHHSLPAFLQSRTNSNDRIIFNTDALSFLGETSSSDDCRKTIDPSNLTSTLSPDARLTPSQMSKLLADLQHDQLVESETLIPASGVPSDSSHSESVTALNHNAVVDGVQPLLLASEQVINGEHSLSNIFSKGFGVETSEIDVPLTSNFFGKMTTSGISSDEQNIIKNPEPRSVYVNENVNANISISASSEIPTKRSKIVENYSFPCECWSCVDEQLTEPGPSGLFEQEHSESVILPTLRNLLKTGGLQDRNTTASLDTSISCIERTADTFIINTATNAIDTDLYNADNSELLPEIALSFSENKSVESLSMASVSNPCSCSPIRDSRTMASLKNTSEISPRNSCVMNELQFTDGNDDARVSFIHHYGDLHLGDVSTLTNEVAPSPSSQDHSGSVSLDNVTGIRPSNFEATGSNRLDFNTSARQVLSESHSFAIIDEPNQTDSTILVSADTATHLASYEKSTDPNNLDSSNVGKFWLSTKLESSENNRLYASGLCSAGSGLPASSRLTATQHHRTLRRLHTPTASRPYNNQLTLTKKVKSPMIHKHLNYLIRTENSTRDNSPVCLGSPHTFSGHLRNRATAHLNCRDRSSHEMQSRGHQYNATTPVRCGLPVSTKVFQNSARPTCSPFGHVRKRTARSSIVSPQVTVSLGLPRRKLAQGNTSRAIMSVGSNHHLHRILSIPAGLPNSQVSSSTVDLTNTSTRASFTPGPVCSDRKSSLVYNHGTRSQFGPLNNGIPLFTSPSPHQYFPDYSTHHHCRVVITRQPEAQHRARYQTEGSRGAIKDRTGTGYPTVQLIGWVGRAFLQIFVASEHGRPKPHSFYEAYLVSGKAAKHCVQTVCDGVSVIEMPFAASNDWTLSVESVGILKLRKSDVEQRTQASSSSSCNTSDGSRCRSSETSIKPDPVTQSQACPMSSTSKVHSRKPGRARLVFRVLLFHESSGNLDVIQATSEPILCTQLVGDPELCRISTSECSSAGGVDLFMLGKNLGKDCHVFFRQLAADYSAPLELKVEELSDGKSSSGLNNNTQMNIIWEKEAVLETEFSHQTHLVCRVPAYDGPSCPLSHPITVQLIARCGTRSSNPFPFTYKPSADLTQPALVPSGCCADSVSSSRPVHPLLPLQTITPTFDTSTPAAVVSDPAPSSLFLIPSNTSFESVLIHSSAASDSVRTHSVSETLMKSDNRFDSSVVPFPPVQSVPPDSLIMLPSNPSIPAVQYEEVYPLIRSTTEPILHHCDISPAGDDQTVDLLSCIESAHKPDFVLTTIPPPSSCGF